MKEITKQKLLKYLKIILPITLIIYLYELTIGDYISFSALSMDNLFYYTTKAVFLFNVAAIALFSFLKVKRKIARVITLIIFYPVAIVFLVYFPLNVFAVVNPHYDKYYFYEQNNFKYYLISERFSALDGSNITFYKESAFLGPIKIRHKISEKELEAKGVNTQKAVDYYSKKYFMKSE